MSTQAATESQNTQETTDTSTNQNEGTQTPDTSTDSNQNEGKISFTSDQQSFINSLVKSEAEKAAAKAKTKAEADAKLSEDEKLKSDLAEARMQLQERDSRDFVLGKAKTAGVNNPNLFYEANKAKFERDEKGAITNFDDILKSSKTDFPELFQTAAQTAGSADAGAGNSSQTTKPEFKGGMDRMSYAYAEAEKKSSPT